MYFPQGLRRFFRGGRRGEALQLFGPGGPDARGRISEEPGTSSIACKTEKPDN